MRSATQASTAAASSQPRRYAKARWINHSCDPNCATFGDEDGRVFIEARRKIRRGEELCYDYRLNVDGRLNRQERAEYACRFGTAKCRGSLLDDSRGKSDRR
jgi:hypothetical protein